MSDAAPTCARGCEAPGAPYTIYGVVTAVLCDRCRSDLANHVGIDSTHVAVHRLRRHHSILLAALVGPGADVERCLHMSDDVHDMEVALKAQVTEWLAVRPAKGPN